MAKLLSSYRVGLLLAGVATILFSACDEPVISSTVLEPETAQVEIVQEAQKSIDFDNLKTDLKPNQGEKPAKPNSKADDNPVAKEKRSYEDFAQEDEKIKPEVHTIDLPATWKRLGKTEEIWVDKKSKEVIVAGHIVLDRGPLEMFVCPEGTKEHESVVAVNCPSSFVHRALVFLKADPGSPTSWDPKYTPAHGPSIEVNLRWKDPKTGDVKTRNATEWIRDMRTKKPMAQQWVFGGSVVWEDPDTKEKIYYADSGEMICLSNFSTAMIDLNIESSDANNGLVYEAFTENIPPIGTKVYVMLKPGKVVAPEKEAVEKKQDDSVEKETKESTEDKEANDK